MSLDIALVPESVLEDIGGAQFIYKPGPVATFPVPNGRPRNLVQRLIHEPDKILEEVYADKVLDSIYDQEHPELADFWECNACGLSRVHTTARAHVESRVKNKIVSSILEHGSAVHLVIYADSNLFSTLVLICKIMNDVVGGKYTRDKVLLDVNLVSLPFAPLLLTDAMRNQESEFVGETLLRKLTQMMRLFNSEGWLRYMQVHIFHHRERYIARQVPPAKLSVLYAMDWLEETCAGQEDFLLLQMAMPADTLIYSTTSQDRRILLKTARRSHLPALDVSIFKDPTRVRACKLDRFVEGYLRGDTSEDDKAWFEAYWTESHPQVEDLTMFATSTKIPRKQAKLWCDILVMHVKKLFGRVD